MCNVHEGLTVQIIYYLFSTYIYIIFSSLQTIILIIPI